MRLTINTPFLLTFDITTEDMIAGYILVLRNSIFTHALVNPTSSAPSTIIVSNLSYKELNILAEIILGIRDTVGILINFELPAHANIDFYLDILAEEGVDLTSLSFTNISTTPTCPEGIDVIPSTQKDAANIFVSEAPHSAMTTQPLSNAKEDMSPANIAVRDKMSREIVLPLLNSNSTLYEFFDDFYSPESIQSLHYNAISECEDTKETLEIINFLIKSGIFPSKPEDITELEDSTSYLPKIKNLLPLAIEKSEWLIATAYLAYIKPGLFYITSELLDLIVRSEKIDLVAAALPHIHHDVFSNYMIPSVTLTANNTDYFRQLPLLFLVSGFRLQRIKIFSDRYPTLSEKINKPLPILLREARDIFKKFFGNVLDLSYENYLNAQAYSIIDFEELLQTLEENIDITKIKFEGCYLDKDLVKTLDHPEIKDLINKILLQLYLNNFSLVNLGSLFLQWDVKFRQEENLTQDELILKKLQWVCDAVRKTYIDLFPNRTNPFSILIGCDGQIASIKQVSGLNYVLSSKNLSSLSSKNLRSIYDELSHVANVISQQDLLSKILKDRLQKIMEKLRIQLENQGIVVSHNEDSTLLYFDIAIPLIRCDDFRTLQFYISSKIISINIRDKDNNTLLHHAIAAEAVNSVYMLVKQPGCELEAINNQGETPFLLGIKSNPKKPNCLLGLFEALCRSGINPHALTPNPPLTIQNWEVARALIYTGISFWSGRYNFDLRDDDGKEITTDELPKKLLILVGEWLPSIYDISDLDWKIFYHTLNLEGKKFTLEQFEELVKILMVCKFTRINLSQCELLEIAESESNRILNNIIERLLHNRLRNPKFSLLNKGFTLEQVITSSISIIEKLKNEIDKPKLSSLSLFNNKQNQILEFFHLFVTFGVILKPETFGDILKPENRALFKEPVMLKKLQELSRLLASTPNLHFPILQIWCSELNARIIELLSSLDVLESKELTDLPEELTSIFETAALSEQAHADSPPSDTALSSDVPPSKDIPEEIHNIHRLKYIKTLFAEAKLKKVEMDLLPEIKMENYINAERKKIEIAIESLQAQIKKILDTLDDLFEKSALIKIGKELQEKVNAYCNVMMGVNAYTKPYPLYCEIRSLAEQFNNEWEKILPANTSSIPAHSQNPATFLAPPTLPPPTSQPSVNSSSSPKSSAKPCLLC